MNESPLWDEFCCKLNRPLLAEGSLPAQSQNCDLPDASSFPHAQLLTLGNERPHEIRAKKLHGDDARLSWPKLLHLGKVESRVKKLTINAERATPPGGGSRPHPPACVRGEQPYLDESIRSPKRHYVPLKNVVFRHREWPQLSGSFWPTVVGPTQPRRALAANAQHHLHAAPTKMRICGNASEWLEGKRGPQPAPSTTVPLRAKSPRCRCRPA